MSSDDVPTLPDVGEEAEGYREGDLVGEKYELLRPLGSGGMGAVWEAENVHLQVPVAVKLVAGVSRDGIAADRLAIEARAAAQIVHPAVVRVFDFGVTAQRDPYIVMELLQGETLRALLDRAFGLDPNVAAQIAVRIAEGLATANARGVVHRDIKPDNIFLARLNPGRIQPKVIDFGVAKLVGPARHAIVTRAGMIVGSPDYMAPEQVLGEAVDQQADVWGLSVTLYEMLAGDRPFRGPTVQHVMRAVLRDRPAKIEGIDDALWAIVERGLRRQKSERWESTSDVADALGAWLRERGVEEDAAAAMRETSLEANARPKSLRPPPSSPPAPSSLRSLRPLMMSRRMSSMPPAKRRNVELAVMVSIAFALVVGSIAVRFGSSGSAREVGVASGGGPVGAASATAVASASASTASSGVPVSK